MHTYINAIVLECIRMRRRRANAHECNTTRMHIIQHEYKCNGMKQSLNAKETNAA